MFLEYISGKISYFRMRGSKLNSLTLQWFCTLKTFIGETSGHVWSKNTSVSKCIQETIVCSFIILVQFESKNISKFISKQNAGQNLSIYDSGWLQILYSEALLLKS